MEKPTVSAFLHSLARPGKPTAKGRKRRRPYRKLPPGQRLLLYMVLASFVSIGQSIIFSGSKSDANAVTSLNEVSRVEPFALAYPLDGLEEELREASKKRKLRTGMFAIEPATGRYVDFHGQESFSAASIIKVPVFVSLLVAIDRREVKPDDVLTIRQDLITGGSGFLQWRTPGSKITVKDAAELMIVVSDNTATNLLIDLLGGCQRLNRQFAGWGLKTTRLRSLLADLEGTNTTSPYELAYLMGRLERGELASRESRDWMYQVMHRTRIKTLLPQGLGPGATILHKTGDIGSMVGDAGIITTGDGRRFIVAVQVERPHNDRRANELIRTLSKITYNHLTRASWQDM